MNKKIVVLSIAVLLLLIACVENKPGSEEPAIYETSTHAIDRVVQPYLALKGALVRGETDQAHAHAASLAGAVSAFMMENDNAAAVSEAVASNLEILREQSEIAGIRKAFSALSDSMIKLVRAQGAGVIPIYIQHCPMALSSGADWISASPAIRNPYYGDAMLTCGVVKDSLLAQ